MMTRRTKRRLMAWMMVLTFISALLVKDVHAHNVTIQQLDQTEQHQTTVQAYCYICNFDLCKMSMPKLFVWQPVLLVKRIVKQLFTAQIVYREPLTVNAHSPPFLIHNS